MIQEILSKLIQNSAFLSHYGILLRALEDSGLVLFLRERSKVRYMPGGDINSVALEGARAAGYQEALDDIFNFDSLYVKNAAHILDKTQREYGGLDEAIARGDLTEEEVNAIRTNGSVDYTKYTATHSTETKR